LTGDGPKKLLVAPIWSGDKKRVLNAVNKAIREKEEGRFGKADKGEKR
jgi:radical SAM superfamily enzyme